MKKKVSTTITRLPRLDRKEEGNSFGMDVDIYLAENNTTIYVRIYIRHHLDVISPNDLTREKVLALLQNRKKIKDSKNWSHAEHKLHDFTEHLKDFDDIESSGDYRYFAFAVKPDLIKF